MKQNSFKKQNSKRNLMPGAGFINNQGFNLVELMIALTLGLIVSLGIMQVLINITNSYRQQTALNHLNESGQYALSYLSRDLRDVGFAGCLSDIGKASNLMKTATSTGTGFDTIYDDFSQAIIGTQGANTTLPVLPKDSIIIKGANLIGSGAFLNSSTAANASLTLYTGSPAAIFTSNGLSQNQLLLVSDCQNGDIFQQTSSSIATDGIAAHAQTGKNLSNTLSASYGSMANIYTLYAHQYSVNNGELVRSSSASNSQTILSNVDGFVIYYGVDTDGDRSVNQYTRTVAATNLSKIVSIRFELALSSTEDNLLPASQAYTFDNQTVTPTDKKLHRVYQQTVALKNRIR